MIEEYNNQNTPVIPMELNELAINSLSMAGKWTRFLSIISFIGLGFMVLLGLFFGTFMGAAMQNMPQEMPVAMPFGFGFMGIIYIILALIYFFPIYYLFNFGRKVNTAILTRDSLTLSDALSNLGKHFQFVGVLAVIMLSMYALIFIGGLLGAAFF